MTCTINNPFLLITDLDGTLLDTSSETTSREQVARDAKRGKFADQKLERFKSAWGLAKAAGAKLVFNTGNSLGALRVLAARYGLPCPDVAILQTGAFVCTFPEGDILGQEVVDTEWADIVCKGFDRQKVTDVLRPLESMWIQNEQANMDKESPKVSVIAKSTPMKDEIVKVLELELPKLGVRAKLLVHSADWWGGDTPCIDILPCKAGKGDVTTFIRRKLGFSEEMTMVAGDSGNDFLMFQVGKERGTVVGSANKEMLEFHEANPCDHHYLAQARCADGILEGLSHFEFLQ